MLLPPVTCSSAPRGAAGLSICIGCLLGNLFFLFFFPLLSFKLLNRKWKGHASGDELMSALGLGWAGAQLLLLRHDLVILSLTGPSFCPVWGFVCFFF